MELSIFFLTIRYRVVSKIYIITARDNSLTKEFATDCAYFSKTAAQYACDDLNTLWFGMPEKYRKYSVRELSIVESNSVNFIRREDS